MVLSLRAISENTLEKAKLFITIPIPNILNQMLILRDSTEPYRKNSSITINISLPTRLMNSTENSLIIFYGTIPKDPTGLLA
jgi:hypothetical protein